MFAQRSSFYTDPKTEALYARISTAHPPTSHQEEVLLQQAEQKTEINSHYNHSDPNRIVPRPVCSSATATSTATSR
jgi:hypothetical protein